MIEELRKQNEKQIQISKREKNQKEIEKQEIIRELLQEKDCFFQIPTQYSYAILEDLGYSPEEQEEIYEKLLGIEEYQKLIKKKRIDKDNPISHNKKRKKKIRRMKKMIKNKRGEAGITLIALVVTIIVLLILAGVTIAMVLGSDGVIRKAELAKERTGEAQSAEEIAMRNLEIQANMARLPNGGKALATLTKDEQGNLVPVPIGFYYVTGTVNTGFVISDNQTDENNANSFEGNQFVWIPVESDAQFSLKSWNGESVGETPNGSNYVDYGINHTIRDSGMGGEMSSLVKKVSKISDSTGLAIDSTKALQESVSIYKGFYIGRFKAISLGIDAKEVAESKKDKTAWTGFSYKQINDATKELYTRKSLGALGSMDGIQPVALAQTKKEVVSHLVTGKEYDSILKWFVKSGALTEAQLKKANSTQIINNLYDLGSNSTELTSEYFGENPNGLHMAGEDYDLFFTSRGENSLSSRKQNSVGKEFINTLDCTARVALYINYQVGMANEMTPAQ